MKQWILRSMIVGVVVGLGWTSSVVSAAPATKKAPKRPGKVDAPTKAKPTERKPALAKPKVKTRKLMYDMYFGSGKVGTMTQTEKMYPNGKTVVNTKSNSKMKVFFRTYKNTMKAFMVYQNGKLQKFSIVDVRQNKKTQTSGYRSAKGIVVKRIVGKKTTTKTFPFQGFQATSSDLQMPMGKKGSRLKRKLLQLPQQKIVTQRIRYKGKVKRKFFGKRIDAYEVRAKGPRGSANLLFTKSGRMLEMVVKVSVFGSFKVRIKKIVGEPL